MQAITLAKEMSLNKAVISNTKSISYFDAFCITYINDAFYP
jgi:hypothetical protein